MAIRLEYQIHRRSLNHARNTVRDPTGHFFAPLRNRYRNGGSGSDRGSSSWFTELELEPCLLIASALPKPLGAFYQQVEVTRVRPFPDLEGAEAVPRQQSLPSACALAAAPQERLPLVPRWGHFTHFCSGGFFFFYLLTFHFLRGTFQEGNSFFI